MKWLQTITSLPILLKGVLTAEDGKQTSPSFPHPPILNCNDDLMKIFILPLTLFMDLQTFFLLSPIWFFFFFHCSKASRTERGCRNYCLQSWSTPARLRSFHYYSLGRGTCAFNDHDIFLVHFGNLKKVHWLFKLSTCKFSFSSSSRNFCHVHLVDLVQD